MFKIENLKNLEKIKKDTKEIETYADIKSVTTKRVVIF